MKKERFRELIDEFVKDERDFSVMNNGTEICFYTEGGYCVVLQDNGKWRLD